MERFIKWFLFIAAVAHVVVMVGFTATPHVHCPATGNWAIDSVFIPIGAITLVCMLLGCLIQFFLVTREEKRDDGKQ